MIKLSALRKSYWPLMLVVVGLNLIGVVSIWSSTGMDAGSTSALLGSYPVRQFIFMIGGIGVMTGLTCINYMFFRRYAWFIYLGVLLLLLAVLVIGESFRGARRWISLGLFNLQPSELAKFAVILIVARYLMYRENLQSLRSLLLSLLLLVIPAFLIVIQPDVGTAFLFFPLFLVMLFAAGVPTKYIIGLVALSLAFLPVGYFYVLEDYQRERITGFLHPEEAPMEEGYHLIRSRIALGTGGITGKGIGESTEEYSRLVPERHNDFIFTVIGEETGLLGTLSVVGLYMLLVLLSIKIAYDTNEPFGRLIILGFAAIITLQALINISMTIGLAPITGVTLPFISYGGSSLMVSYLMVGLILSVSAHPVPSLSGEDIEMEDDVLREADYQHRKLLAGD